MAKGKLFGTDGVRGVANVYPMTADFAMRLGMAAAELVCHGRRRVAIAKDTRISGDMLEAALIAGFTAKGVDVIKLGVLPTPAVTTFVSALDVDMAVMITASHNPFKDNGIKLIAQDGSKLADDMTAALEALVEKNQFTLEADVIGQVSENITLTQKYQQMALSVTAEAQPLAGMKIVLDCANGCFATILPQVFEQLGAEVTALSCHPNGRNINLDCGSQHSEAMQAEVLSKKADLGIAVDGDGDRIIICDEQGRRLDGDQIIAFLGQHYQQTGRLKGGAVVATIVSNPALDRFLESIGVRCVRSAVGERKVIEEMKKLGANIGGEESGHMVVADYSQTGDALIAGLTVAMGLKESGRKMSEIFPLFTPMLKLRIDTAFDSPEEMRQAFEQPEFQAAVEAGKQKMDGQGKVLIRKSGTEPKIQVWVWSDDAELAETTSREISAVLAKFSGFVAAKKVL